MIKQRNIHKDYRIIGVFSSAANYLADRNKTSAAEGDTYYDTTLNQLRTHNGSDWSPAGMSGIGAGSMNATASIGSKITIDGSTVSSQIEIECSDNGLASGALLNLDNDDTTNDPVCLDIDNAADATTAVSIDIDSTAGYDIQGTSDSWQVDYTGDALFHDIWVKDDLGIQFGSAASKAGDVSVLFHDGAVGTAGNGLLFDAVGADEQIQFGDATYTFDVLFIGETATTNLMKWDMDGGADSVGALVFDNADLDLGDSDMLRIGDGQDVTIKWDAANLLIEAATDNTGQIRLGATNSMDLSIYGSTATNICLFDVNESTYGSLLDLNGWDIRLQDDDQLIFGDGADVVIDWDQTKLVIACDDGRVDLGVSGGGFDMYWYTEDATNYIYWDEDNSRMDLVDIDLRLDDDARLYFGSDANAYLVWDNTNSTIDIVGNVALTGTFTVSGAFDIGNFAFGDDEELRFGNSNDFVFHYDSTAANLLIDAAAANDIIDIGSSVDTDVIFHGGTATYDVHWDSSENTLGFLDDAVLSFGGTAASPDVEIVWDQTKLKITGDALAVNFGIDDHGMDVLMYGATSGAYILWDESANQLVGVGGAQISLNDSVELLLGTGASNAGDFNIYSDGTSLFVKEISAAGKSLLLGQSGKGLAVTFYGDDAGYDLQWVQASNMLEFQDNAVLAFGTESDITATWNASDLLIEWATQDTGAIKFGATDAGDVNFYANTPASYASFDSGAAELILEGYDLGLQDDDILQFGDANDITITWDQSKLVIEGATADTAISIGKATNLDLVIYGDTSTDAVTFDTGSEDININGFDVSVNDDDLVKFGDTDDITMTWDGSASNFLIDGATANVSIDIGATSNLDVIIYGDSTNDTVAFDTSAELCTFNGFDLTLQDADILSFGDAGTTDCYITWDTTRLQVVPSSNVFIGDKTNYVSISSAGAMTQTGTAAFVANSAAANMGGLQIPYHATSSPSGAGGTGAIWFEVDASKLWVNIGGTNWIGTVLS